MLMTEDVRCKMWSSLLWCQESHNSQQDTAHKAYTHWKCWIEMTTHQCGPISTLMDPLIQQSETAVAGSTSALAMAKHFQGRRLWACCEATTRLSILLCMKLLDFSAQRHHPCPILSSLQTASLLFKACSRPESSWKETHSAFFVTCQGRCLVDPCLQQVHRKP